MPIDNFSLYSTYDELEAKQKKKTVRNWLIALSFFLLLTAILLCTLQEERSDALLPLEEHMGDGSLYPVYDSLTAEEKQVYLKIVDGFVNFKKTLTLGYDTEEECSAVYQMILDLFGSILYEQAEFFWVDPYNCSISTAKIGNRFQIYVDYAYIMTREQALAQKDAFDNKVEEIISQACAEPGTFERIRYIFDYILSHTTYDHQLTSSQNYRDPGINAYGCLMNGKAICSGYAMTFSLLMRKLGFPCGVEFSTYGEILPAFGAHVWNYCKLDEDYYYFDLTWSDLEDGDPLYPYMEHTYFYFGITAEELSRSQELLTNAPTPDCNGKVYNYYHYLHLNFEVYDFEAVKQCILSQRDENYIILRFDSISECKRATVDLMENGVIYSILHDKGTISYACPKSGNYLIILFPSDVT